MAEGQSPENSPPSPTPPPPSSPDSTQQQSPPPPNSSSPSPSPPAPPPPPPDSSSSSPPPPPSSDSQPPPSPQQGNNDNNNGGNNDNNNNNNNDGNNNNGNNNNDGNNGNNNNNGGGSNNHSPSPPSRNSDHNSPSPPRSLAPPRSSGGGSNSSRNDTPNTAAIIGIAAGAGLLLLVMILFCVCCCRKKKKKNQMPYYASNGYATGKGDQYQQQQQQYNNQNDHVMNMSHQQPGSNNNINWMNSPPPPPPPVSGGVNTGNSSEIYSGPYGPALPPPHPSVALGFNQSTFTYDELAAATQNFSQARLLGQGGFGYVHKGILPNGKEIAVKSLKAGSGQGEREFQAEVDIISRVHHRFLVSLVGYCIAEQKMLLVYEFLPNDTLEFHLHGKSGKVLDWPTRLRIALGSAKGLAYLHEDCHPKIIHRDIKASNILLDESFEAKVADFGLAKLSQDNVTHVSTRIMGTFGYLAPEYAASGKLTDRSDVFSFGVMLLELITGRRPVDLTGEMEDSLVDWARPLCLNAAEDGDYSELVDPRLENQYEPYEMARMVACAAAAVRHSARRRPKMSQIVRALEGDASLDDLNEVKPGQSSYLGRGSSSNYDSSTYSADMRKVRKVALDSHDYGASSEYGNTSEYGLDPSSSSSEEIHSGRGAANNNKTTPSRAL
ncbi:unnamed protein product [Eruca vesicaria subsp. sativa]|uniref:non-specific serine/threonine protein kinase n=1 Tax=Eruca vesicaria subsp. sativa TaxID=29727 RepID=A0ABC8LQ33_ERUVS|nr:unnamed protein product [Eruca vesicaria subsp. sativa]